MKDFIPSSKIKIIQISIAMLLFLKITSTDISNCNEGDSLKTATCFNNLITFNNYRAGQFEKDKNGNLFLLYSNSQETKKRLFYGITNEGWNYFENDKTKEIEISSEGSAEKREESRIIFVTSSSGGQYLLSTSAGDPSSTLVEYYNIGKDAISSFSKATQSLFSDIGSDTITSSQYSLFRLPSENKYFIAFAQSNKIIIIKFKFNGENLNNYYSIAKKEASSSNKNYKTISCFLMEDELIIVLFYMKSYTMFDSYGNSLGTSQNYSKIYYYANDDTITYSNEEDDSNDVDPIPGDFFFKGLYIAGNFSAFLYSRGSSTNFHACLNISKLSYETDYFSNSPYYTFTTTKQINLKSEYDINANVDLLLNEFIKINSRRLAFITTEGKSGTKPNELSIILFDISGEDYSDIVIKKCHHSLDEYSLQNEIAAFVYNGFLAFSGTYSVEGTDYNSVLAFFGYPYGIDTTINLYPYLNNVSTFSTDSDKNLYTYLMDNMHLENNIFGYEPFDCINLITIPGQISFYRLLDSDEEGSLLTGNVCFGERHILKQNQDLITANQYYDLKYQYLVKESSSPSNIYSGRINKLTFNIKESEDSGDN